MAASMAADHPMSALVRDTAPSDPAKADFLEGFRNSGVTVVKGDVYDHESIVMAIKQVNVVISAVKFSQLADQSIIIAAVKEGGNVKRFLPSEFGHVVERANNVSEGDYIFAEKIKT